MSKFIEKLEKVGQTPSNPLGFGPASRANNPVPLIMVVGQVSAEELSKNSALSEAQVDAVLVSPGNMDDSTLSSVAESLKDRIWGVALDSVDEAQAARLKEKGCDFIVFDAERSSAAVLSDEELGKLIAVKADLDEDTARAVHELPIDAALFSPEMELLPLTVRKLIEVQKVRGLVGKPFIMAAPAEIGKAELEAFRNAQITGVLVKLASPEDATRMKEAIGSLPRQRSRRNRSDITPQAPYGFEPPRRSRDDDEEDDEDY